MVPSVSPKSTIGVDLGGTKLLAGLIGADHSVHNRAYRLIGGLPLDELVAVAREAVAEVGAGAEVDAVGFGIPCLIDQRTGVSVRSVHLPLDGVSFGELMAEGLPGVRVAVDNDANCAVLAEWRAGSARGAGHVVLLTLGTGIGGGLVLDGRIYRGAIGAGAELGHMTVDLDGPPCFGDCPNTGCLEAIASGSALARDAAVAVERRPDCTLAGWVAGGRELSGELVTEAAEAGDPVAESLIEALGTRLGAGLAGLTMIFNPEVIVIGGGVAQAGERLLAPARAELTRRTLSPSRDLVRVERAHFGPDAGMIGAALLARGDGG